MNTLQTPAALLETLREAVRLKLDLWARLVPLEDGHGEVSDLEEFVENLACEVETAEAVDETDVNFFLREFPRKKGMRDVPDK